MDEKYNVFLSHNSADKPTVRKIATRLKRAKLKPFLDEIDLTPGRTWQQELTEALNNCRCVAVFYGPAGEGGWHDQEKQVALKQAVAARDDGDSESRATLLAEAEPLLRRAVEIFDASLGPDHPNTQTVAGNYRLLLEAMKKGK